MHKIERGYCASTRNRAEHFRTAHTEKITSNKAVFFRQDKDNVLRRDTGENSKNSSIAQSTGGNMGNVVLNMRQNDTDKTIWQKTEPINHHNHKANATRLGTDTLLTCP